MNPTFRLNSLTVPATLAMLAATHTPAPAGTMSASPTPPTVLGEDIANYAAVTGNDKWFAENSGAGAAKGQTFTTGSNPVVCKSITYQVTSSQKAEPTKTYVVRLGTVSGTAFSQIHTETFTQNFTWNGGEYMTWTFETPVLLSPNTTYGIDVGMTASTSGWQTGIPYINLTANAFAGGVRYSSGTSGVGTNTLSLVSNGDRIFHISLEHPMAPQPPSGSEVPAGDLTLSWTNMTPTTGTDVWVDVWFGTDPGALTKVADAQPNLTSFLVNLPGADTYYWRIDSYLDGAPTGTPVQSTVFSFLVFDSDGDGFPDDYEQLHTDPPSPTALNRDDDRDMDGVTNWDEYQNTTNPSDPDTDGDGLLDGNSITLTSADPRYSAWATDGILFTDNGADRTFRGELAIGTDPLKQDTDGDGLLDGVETHTGTWVSASDTGTNPLNPDTDGDGLKDGVETKTGVFVSASNTGTNPLNPDTDGDGAGDWYEITASFTNPFSASSKPNVPYPLPDPDLSTGATGKRVKVYIMSGQSNMVGFGTRDGTGDNSLQTMTLRDNKFPNLVNDSGGWTTRQDVHYRGVISDTGKVRLSPANLGSTFGPELGFGYIMGWLHDEPVLLLKSSIGNRSLGWDVLPSGSVSYPYGGYQYAGYGQSTLKWLPENGPSPFQWYAGKQYDDYFLDEEDMGPLTAWVGGTVYPDGTQLRHNSVLYISKDRKNPDGTDIPNHTASPESEPGIGAEWQTYWQVYSIFNAVDVLDNFATEYPDWASQGFEIAGFVWWQGDKDRYDLGHATQYEQNLVKLITSLRNYYTNRYPGKVVENAPFVLATLGQTPLNSTDPAEKAILDAQLAVDGDFGKYEQFAGNVKTVYAHPLSEGGASNSHYNGRAGTYMLVGDALGRAMVELQGNIAPPGDGYTGWVDGPFSGTLTDPDPTLDFDGGGLASGIEWVLGGDPTSSGDDASIAPTLDTTSDPDGKVLFVFRRSPEAGTDANTTIQVQYGSDFVGWNHAVHQGSGTDQITITEQANGFGSGIDKVTVALPASLAGSGKFFARLSVAVAP
jgi:alpha-galactosidase